MNEISFGNAITMPRPIPNNQAIIETSEVENCKNLLKLTFTSFEETGYPAFGLFTGPKGVGKSVAIYSFLTDLFKEGNHSTFFSPVLAFEAQPSTTDRALAVSLYKCLGKEVQSRQTKFVITPEIKQVIKDNFVKLIIIDEANHLDKAALEIVRSIIDDRDCAVSVAFFGGDPLSTIINKDSYLKDRIYPSMEFTLPNLNETLYTFLPNIKMPYWQLDVENPKDIEMGKFIFKKGGFSYRKMRTLLQAASQLVKRAGGNQISIEDLEDAVYFNSKVFPVKSNESKNTNDDDGDDQPQKGDKEAESEARLKAKKAKNGG